MTDSGDERGKLSRTGECDAVILAGGRAAPAMAARMGTPVRALFAYRDKPFVQWAYEALRACARVGRIAVIGPEELLKVPGLSGADLILAERESITANLFASLAALQPNDRVLVTACDNPMLTTHAFNDLLDRAPRDVAAAYPILKHGAFLDRFPRARNVGIRLRDGAWIGGDCVILRADAIPHLRRAIGRILDARKSKVRMVNLLGWRFALRLAAGRVSVADVERRCAEIVGMQIRFVHDCDAVFAIDIDDPVDWDYLEQWEQQTGARRGA